MTSSEKPQGLTAARIAIYAIAAFLIAVLQTSRLGNIGLFGVRPQLVLALVCAAAYFCGSATGAVCGIMGGALTDALGGTGISILALLYMLEQVHHCRHSVLFSNSCVLLSTACSMPL